MRFIQALRAILKYISINPLAYVLIPWHMYNQLFKNAKWLLQYYTDIWNSDSASPLGGDVDSSSVSVEGIGTLNIFIDSTT